MQLNQEQINCIGLNKGHYLILAGAGSGKTLAITQRFIRLCTEVSSYSILCVTFSNKAAHEISHRISKSLQSDGLWIGTFHSIAFRLLMQYDKLHKNTIIIDEWDKHRILINLGLSEYTANIYKAPAVVYEKYITYCKENNLIDFDTILNTLYDELQNEQFRSLIISRFEYIMVDEYQDTSELQRKILQLITHDNLLCVGDEDQLIYSWRNASIDNILKFKEHFINAQIFTLLTNYRSSANIVDLANRVIQLNVQRYHKELTFVRQKAYRPNLVCMNKVGIGEYIKGFINSDGTKAVLVRTTMLIKQVEEEFLKHGVPYEIVNGQGLLNKKEFRILISYLRVLILNDRLGLETFCSYPKRHIGPKTIQHIDQLLNEMNIIQAIEKICPKEHIRLQVWFEAITIQQQWNALIQLTELPENNMIVQQVKEYMSKFSSIQSFLSTIMLNQIEEQVVSNKIYLMTIHAAKGLEFDSVFLPFVVEGCIPCKTSIINNNIEEERRLMYVAITRAKTHLHLMYRLTDSPRNCFGISRFLASIPSHIYNPIVI